MKKATLYRMKTDRHICPFGLRSLQILKSQGFEIKDNILATRENTEEFKKKYNVKTTPQIFIEDKRIGGFDDLLTFLNLKHPKRDLDKKTYVPIITVFSIAAASAISLNFKSNFNVSCFEIIKDFISLSMTILAIQKLSDLYSFTNQFITYDLLGMRSLKYAYTYPFLEAFVGVAMLGRLFPFISSAIALLTGSIGATSVINAVYLDKRDLKCACVGGGSNVPLGFVSLSENLAMIAMGLFGILKTNII